MIGVMIYLKHNGINVTKIYPWEKHKLILGRCTCGVSTFFGLKFGLTLLPLTLHAILMQTNVFWTSILSTIFLQDKIKKFEYVAIPIAFLGIVAMVLNKE